MTPMQLFRAEDEGQTRSGNTELKTRWLRLAALSSQINPTNGLTAAPDAFPPAVPEITHPRRGERF